jgi:hypothetical protein
VINKTAIYIKQTGEPLIPVTARIEWMPDGKIKPLMYWMPDGGCCQIKHVFEMTALSFLKERGEGIRFKVKAEIIETHDPYDGILHSQYETYLYLADNLFCGKNFIDGRYNHPGKEYIAVTIDFFPDADYELIYFNVKGERYMVEKKIKVEPRGSYHAGGVGIWHKVEARLINDGNDEDPDLCKSVRRMAALYFEVNKWFVSLKIA